MSDNAAEPLTVAIVNDYDVVVRGVVDMIGDAPPLKVIELDSMVDPQDPVDLVLFDSFGAQQGVGADVERLLGHPHIGRLVVYSWNTAPELVAEARRAGVAGYLSKRLDADELVQALLKVAHGEPVFQSDEGAVEPEPEVEAASSAAGKAEWPGREFGLTARESEVVGLIVHGLTNQQIAERAYLSINSVKTYIRSAYRKMGVERRSEAILWGLDHGFQPRPRRERLG